MSAFKNARERARAEITSEITAIARTHLAEVGAAGLSLRAVARDMGMVSSALHRYFPTKDDLLTALIIEGYNSIGTAVEEADGKLPTTQVGNRWEAVAHAVRNWALANPNEFVLLYGSPVPGYQAPEDTVAAAVRDTRIFGAIINEAFVTGQLVQTPGPMPVQALEQDAGAVREFMPDVDDATIWRAVATWTGLYGWIIFEQIGQFNNAIENRDLAFAHQIALLAQLVGIPAAQLVFQNESTSVSSSGAPL